MKKARKSSKKGFTLVELIVVLVILAILAAMLVPALTGYIKRARQEKDYQFAATVLTAAQSAATYQYSLSTFNKNTKITKTTSAGRGETVSTLVGTNFTSCQFTVNSRAVITSGTVTCNGYTYVWNGTAWSPKSGQN